MSKLTIEKIKSNLEIGWTLLSTNYNNLDTELEFQCPEGHKVYNTWRKLRNNFICPVCKENKLKNQIDTIYTKSKGYRILALDQATHRTGWAIFDNKQLIQSGIFKTENLDEIERFLQIKYWFLSMINNWKPDEIGLEGIQYQTNVGVTTFQTLARLQGILMITCKEKNIPFKICPTSTWRAACGVKGKTRVDKKRSMQLLIKKWFDITVEDDIADAIGIGKYMVDNKIPQIEIVQWE